MTSETTKGKCIFLTRLLLYVCFVFSTFRFVGIIFEAVLGNSVCSWWASIMVWLNWFWHRAIPMILFIKRLKRWMVYLRILYVSKIAATFVGRIEVLKNGANSIHYIDENANAMSSCLSAFLFTSAYINIWVNRIKKAPAFITAQCIKSECKKIENYLHARKWFSMRF